MHTSEIFQLVGLTFRELLYSVSWETAEIEGHLPSRRFPESWQVRPHEYRNSGRKHLKASVRNAVTRSEALRTFLDLVQQGYISLFGVFSLLCDVSDDVVVLDMW